MNISITSRNVTVNGKQHKCVTDPCPTCVEIAKAEEIIKKACDEISKASEALSDVCVKITKYGE